MDSIGVTYISVKVLSLGPFRTLDGFGSEPGSASLAGCFPKPEEAHPGCWDRAIILFLRPNSQAELSEGFT